jgi:hypothetical protein
VSPVKYELGFYIRFEVFTAVSMTNGVQRASVDSYSKRCS